MLHPSPGSRRAWPRALRHAGLFAAAAAMLGACASSSIEAGTGGAGGSAAGSGGHSGSGGGGAATGSGGVEATGGAPTVDAPAMDQSAGRDQTGGGDALGGCTDAAYILCEDFEATAVGAIPTGWTRQGAAALSTVTDAQAAHGRHALMLGAQPSGARRIATPAAAFGSGHWGRIFYKVQTPAPRPGSGVVHSTLVVLSGQNPQGGGSEEVRVVDTVENTAGKHQFLYNVQPQGAEFGTGSAYNWTFDGQWHCAEWHIDATDQSYHFYFDGAEITQIAKTNGPGKLAGTGIPMAFMSLAVGWNNYQTIAPGFVAWIDDVAIAHQRIGCPAP